MAATKKTTKTAKAKAPKAEPKAKAKKKPEAATEAASANLDRKGLALRARQLKTELLAIRFNIQSPNLNEYRKKRRELATILSQLG